jgi:HEAT repeat protein
MLKDEFDPAEKEALRQAEIEQNLELLKTGDLNGRKTAIKRLGQMQAAPEAILPFLGDTDLETRLEAIGALANLNEMISGDLRAEIISHLLGGFNDPNKRVISASVRALGMLHTKEAIPEIREFLEDSDQGILFVTIIALARLEDHASLEKILAFLDARSSYLRQAAWHAIGIMNHTPMIPGLLAEIQATLDNRPLSSQAFALLKEHIAVCKRMKVTEAVPLLIQIIRTEIGLRTKAVEALSSLGIETFPEELLDLLADPNRRLRASLLKLVDQTNYDLPSIHLRKLLNHESAVIRFDTLELVGQRRKRACVPTVRFLCYRDSAPHVRSNAIATLVELTGTSALPDLQALAFDPQPVVRFAVAKSIGDLRTPLPPQAISILEHLRNDSEIHGIAAAILERFPEHTIPSGPLTIPALYLPFPEDWVVTQQDFLTACIQWHATLAETASNAKSAEEESEVQSALSSLIVTLSRGQ